MTKQFFKAMALDSAKMEMSDNAKYAVLQAKDDILCGTVLALQMTRKCGWKSV